jgi:hypothetical protein
VRDDGLHTCKHPPQPLRCGGSPRRQSWEDVTRVCCPRNSLSHSDSVSCPF